MRFLFWLGLGLVLGPSFLNLEKTAAMDLVAQIAGGIFLFTSGCELKFFDLKEERRFFRFGFIGSFVVPVLLGLLVFKGNLFLSFAVAISALPVAIQILKEKGLYNSILSRRAIGLASLCDIFPWVLLLFLLPGESILGWVIKHWMVFGFFLGLILGRFEAFKMPKWVETLQLRLLSPLFFVGLGWGIDLVTHFSAPMFLKILVFATLSKFLGTYIASRMSGEKHFFSWNLGWILNARGAMEIVAAQFAFAAGLINAAEFSSLVLLGVVTSVMAIPLARKAVA